MFLSFIVPVYNVEKYLEECLDSLLDQDIDKSDYEIVCVNDGSTDGSLAILRDYEAKYANIRVIDKENGGVASARNAGLDAAQGDYIWFFDSDDLVLCNFLGTLRSHIAETDADRVKVGTYIFREVLTDSEIEALEKGELKVNSHFYDSSSVTCVLRRSFLQRHNCRFNYPELTHGEDSIFMFEVVANQPLCTELDFPVYFYRHRPGSATTSASETSQKRKLKSFVVAAQIMKKHYDNGVGDPRDTANLLMSYIWYVMDGCTRLPGRERKEMLRKMKDLGLYPFHRPEACSHMRSYQTTRTDLIGKAFDKAYIHMHRPWGFGAMILLRKLIDAKKKLHRLPAGAGRANARGRRPRLFPLPRQRPGRPYLAPLAAGERIFRTADGYVPDGRREGGGSGKNRI